MRFRQASLRVLNSRPTSRSSRLRTELLERRRLLAVDLFTSAQFSDVTAAAPSVGPFATISAPAHDQFFADSSADFSAQLAPSAPVIAAASRNGTTLTITFSAPGASSSNSLRVDFTTRTLDGTQYSLGSRTVTSGSSTQTTFTIPASVPFNPVHTASLRATSTNSANETSPVTTFAASGIQFQTITLTNTTWLSGTRSYDSVILNVYDPSAEKGLTIGGTANVTVTNSLLRLQDPLLMTGGSLTVTKSFIDDDAKPSTGRSINTSGASTVNFTDVTVHALSWQTWKFQGTSIVTLDHVNTGSPRPWLVFTEYAQVTSRYTNFRGSIGLFARANVDNSPQTHIELIFDGGNAVVDEDLPESVGATAYNFPNSNDSGVNLALTVTNSTMIDGQWGVSIDGRDKVTLRNSTITANLTLFDRTKPRTRLVGSISGLDDRLYGATSPETITISGISSTVTPRLTLDRVTVDSWYPYAGLGNTLTVSNSVLADSANSWGSLTQLTTNNIQNSTASYVRVNNYVRTNVTDSTIYGNVESYGNGQITLTRAHVTGDVIASQTSVITVNAGTVIDGQTIVRDSARIILPSSFLAGSLLATDQADVTLDATHFAGPLTLRGAAVARVRGTLTGSLDGVLAGSSEGYAIYVARDYAAGLALAALSSQYADTPLVNLLENSQWAPLQPLTSPAPRNGSPLPARSKNAAG